MTDLNMCTACPVATGLCPRCGTFWWINPTGKRVGVRRVMERPEAAPTYRPDGSVSTALHDRIPPVDSGQWPHVVIEPPGAVPNIETTGRFSR